MSETVLVDETPKPAPAKRGSPRGRVLMVLAGSALLTAIIGGTMYLRTMNVESTDNAYIEGHVVPISPRIAGFVKATHFKDNQTVEAGTLLIELDPAPWQTRVDAAKASVQLAQAQLETGKTQLQSAKNMLSQARADVAVAQAAAKQVESQGKVTQSELERDQADLTRIQQLAQTSTVSRQDLEHAAAAVHTRQAEVEAAHEQTARANAEISRMQSAVAVAEGTVAERASQVTECESKLELARASLRAAELDLADTRIVAPSAGQVSSRGVEPGAYVQAGQLMLNLIQPGVWVVANLKETQLGRVRPGQPVNIRIDAYPGLEFSGRVESLQPGTGSRFSLLPSQNASGNFVKVVQRVGVKIVFDDTEAAKRLNILPGMSAVPEISVKGS